MKLDRRNFLLDTPAALAGLGAFAEMAFAQNQTGVKVAPEAVDFWVTHMGLSPEEIVGGVARTRGRRPNGPSVSDVAREPLFLSYDPDSGALTTVDQVPIAALAMGPDTSLDYQMVRMRLNDDDEKQFRSYASGGIYVDFQQAAQPQQSFLELAASAVFSAFSPASPSQPGSGAKATRTSSGSSSSSAAWKGTHILQAAKPSAPTAPGTSIPLQAATQSQSVVLPGGAGKHSFACFAKDKQKTVFGTFVSVFATLLNSPAATYLPMLAMPGIGPVALNAVRALVGNLQAHGGEQQFIMMSPTVDIVTTQAAAKANPNALRFRPGSYIVIPKEHGAAIKDKLNSHDDGRFSGAEGSDCVRCQRCLSGSWLRA